MKIFLQHLFASILAAFIVLVILIILISGIIGGMLTQANKPVIIGDNTILNIQLDRTIMERSIRNPLSRINPLNASIDSIQGLDEILKAINQAGIDSRIKGIYLSIMNFSAGAATVEEIREALRSFKETGKFVIAYSDSYSQKGYYLSTIADMIYLHPQGDLQWCGLRNEIMFYKNTFAKFGIEPQVFRHGKYKSAVEPYLLDKMSLENRQQITSYLNSIWKHWLSGITLERNITAVDLNRYADKLLIYNGKAALEYRMIDGLMYNDEIEDKLWVLLGGKAGKEIPLVLAGEYVNSIAEPKKKAIDRIAVIYGEGDIVNSGGSETEIGSAGFCESLRQAREDVSVKAVVLRINSPGGDALAADIIRREVVLTREVKPVIVSMGDLAASGGYWISSPASYIICQPVTLTGSIGVFGLWFNIQKGLAQNLGLTVDVVKTNKSSDTQSMYRPVSAEERKAVELSIDDIYNSFVTNVSEDREIEFKKVDQLGQGQVYTGTDAVTNHLVDETGGINKAIKKAAELSNISAYEILELPEQKSALQLLVEDFGGQIKASFKKDPEDIIAGYYMDIIRMLKKQGIKTRVPYDIEIY